MVSPLKDIAKKNTKKNIGVDAKDIEIKNTVKENDGVSSNSLNDSNNSLYVHLKNVIEKIDNTDDEASCMSNIPSTFCSEASGSYIQVTLKKHHSKKETKNVPEQHVLLTASHRRQSNNPNTIAVQTSPLRVPATTNIINQVLTANSTAGEGDTSDNVNRQGNLDVGKSDLYVLSHPIVLASYSHLAHNLHKTYVNTGTSPERSSGFKKNFKKSVVLKGQLSEEKLQTKANFSSVNHDSGQKCISENKEPYKGMCWIKTKLSKLSAPSPNTDPERMDIYYFDHGNCNYYETTDLPPITISDYYADKTENVATRFWAEVFGIPYLVLTFFTAFLLQFERFILQGVLRPLIVGFIQMLSDYLVKPLLAVIFNAIIQPPLIFVNNITSSFRDAFQPISQCIGYFVKECSKPIKSFRLVEINKKHNRSHKHIV